MALLALKRLFATRSAATWRVKFRPLDRMVARWPGRGASRGDGAQGRGPGQGGGWKEPGGSGAFRGQSDNSIITPGAQRTPKPTPRPPYRVNRTTSLALAGLGDLILGIRMWKQTGWVWNRILGFSNSSGRQYGYSPLNPGFHDPKAQCRCPLRRAKP